jgi:hypothetical protein
MIQIYHWAWRAVRQTSLPCETAGTLTVERPHPTLKMPQGVIVKLDGAGQVTSWHTTMRESDPRGDGRYAQASYLVVSV